MQAWDWNFAFLSRCFDVMGQGGTPQHRPAVLQASIFFLTSFYSSVSDYPRRNAFRNASKSMYSRGSITGWGLGTREPSDPDLAESSWEIGKPSLMAGGHFYFLGLPAEKGSSLTEGGRGCCTLTGASIRHCLGAFGGGYFISFGVTLDTNKMHSLNQRHGCKCCFWWAVTLLRYLTPAW